ncbi:MAG TPA: hypothetical protein VMS54_07435 [Vicinamibacterales bacterium]|nr:hypothetical protein [Vicinamibacterales bacterium]
MTRFRIWVLGTLMLAVTGSGAVLANQAVPFKGNGTNSFTGGSGNTVTASGSGQATLLGEYTRTEALTFTSPVDFTGWVVFVAANGDELRCDMTGQFVSATGAVGTYVITGGTGRFANATGQAEFRASLTSPGTFDVTFDGTVDR